MTTISSFDGGISIRIDPSLIKINEAQTLVNVDPNPIILSSAKGSTSLSIAAKDYIYKLNNVWYSSNNARNYLEFNGTLYYTESGRAYYIKNNESYNLGIEKPESVKAYDSNNNPIVGSDNQQFIGLSFNIEDYDFSKISKSFITTSGNLPSDNYNYKLTVVRGYDDVAESNFVFSVAGGAIITLSGTKGLKLRLYRDYSGYKKIAEVTLGDTPNVIYDTVFQLPTIGAFSGLKNLTVSIQYTVTLYNLNNGYESPPLDYSKEYEINTGKSVRIRNFPTTTDQQVTHYRLYRIGGSLTSMGLIAEIPVNSFEYIDVASDIEATSILESFSYYPSPEGISFIDQAYGIFFGIVGNELRFTDIGMPNSWPPENSFKLSDIATGVLAIPQGILVFTKTTTNIILGTNKTQFTKTLISSKIGCLIGHSCQVVKNSPIWVSYEGICTLQNGYVQVLSKPLLGKITFLVKQSVLYDEQYILLLDSGELYILDLRNGFRFYTIKIPNLTGIYSDGEKLYGVISGTLHTLFTGELLSLEYLSPVLIEDNHSEYKVYNNIYIRSKGNFTVTVYIDDENVLTKEITGNTTHDIKVPASKQRGYSCSLKIVGIGKVYTIDLKALGRQNGR